MKSLSKAANKAVTKINEAAVAIDKEAIQVAAKAAEVAANDAKIAAEKIARQTEAELKKQAEELAVQAKRVEEEAKKVSEKQARQLIEAAQKAAEELNRQTVNLVKNQITNALESVVANIQDFSEAGQILIKQIEAEIQNLIDLANIDALKRKLLQKVEQLSEEYLTSKVEPIAQDISLTSISDVKLNMSISLFKIEVYVYFLLEKDKFSDPSMTAIAVLTIDLEQSITKLKAPEVDPQFNINKDKLELELFDIIEKKIDKEKNNLIQGFLEAFFSDYFVIFDRIIKLIPK